ncbi:unnamed protein product [Tilletia controversa]|uniref:Uncharacterized protein n=3 Tax=Tilletia TaxID=13289 RepID=A0A8X7MWC3_9BASI|nr:hypothetical protein CF336_g176 [Tilletia laevis]KAE8202203.1 hypothetical protein CF328_g2350 [Tilletia controversa]KAE8265599.1 hypothetical protein A4X03_0g172 [Tilletia caries]KAE8208900.1 hypothetical protein CF335_g72 [Tilletia laevis]KAE8249994.1 hypothetical protein A4X06_0g2969 [Tilletia controversa]
MVYFTPVRALTVSLAVAALASDAVQARPAYNGAEGPSAQLQPQGRMQKVVLRSSPPPPLPAGVQTDGNSRRSFTEQGNYKRSKSRAAAANDRVFRRSEAGSKRSPSKQVHEHIHIHEHGSDRGRGRKHGHGSYRGHDWAPVVLDDRVRHHSLHWAEHHGLIPFGSSRPTLVQIGKKGVTVVNKVVAAFPAAGKIVAAIPKKVVPAAPKKAAPKPAAKGPAKAGKGKRRHDETEDDEYDSEHAHIHEHDHDHEHEHEHESEDGHLHKHAHEKRDQVARITLGNDGKLYRSASKHEGDLLSLHLRSETPGLATGGSIDDDGTEIEADTDGAPLSKRRHDSKDYYYYGDDEYWGGSGSRNAHVHAHIHDHGHRGGYRHGDHSYGGGHVHEHVHVHKRGAVPAIPADTSAVTAKVGEAKAGTPLGAVDASDVTGTVGKSPKPTVPRRPTGNKKGTKKHNLNTLSSKVHPVPARNPPHPAAAGAFVDSAQLTHTLAERGLLGGLLKPLLAPLNALPGFIMISDLLFGDDNLLKKVAALVLHAEPAKNGMSASPGNVLAAAPPYKYTLMSSTDERTQVYLVPADAPSSEKGAAAQQSFASVMNGTATANADATAAASNETVIVKIVVPLLNATTGIPTTWCATFATKPPSPLELQPCTGAPLSGAAKNASSFVVVPEIAGKSQRFQYTPSTGALSPLYQREMVGTLKQVLAAKPNTGDDSVDDSSNTAEDADDADFFGEPADGSDASAPASDSYGPNGLYRQLAVDTTLPEDDDSSADPDSDLNDPAAAGVSGFSDVNDAAGAGDDEEDGSSQDTVAPLNAKAKAPAPGAGVQLKFVPAGTWAQQFAAAAAADTATVPDDSTTSSTTASDDSAAPTPTSTDDAAPTVTADAMTMTADVPATTTDAAPSPAAATDAADTDDASTSSSATDASAPSSADFTLPTAAPSQRR